MESVGRTYVSCAGSVPAPAPLNTATLSHNLGKDFLFMLNHNYIQVNQRCKNKAAPERGLVIDGDLTRRRRCRWLPPGSLRGLPCTTERLPRSSAGYGQRNNHPLPDV